MLSIRNAELTDAEAFVQYLNKEKIEPFALEMKETMLLVDEETIIGFATASLKNLRPTLDGIYIPEKLRGHLLGDAVLRGLLYYFMNRGFEQVYALKDSRTEAFFRHVGFEDDAEDMKVHLESFFDRKCRGCKDKNE